jgi:hypothetical protein
MGFELPEPYKQKKRKTEEQIVDPTPPTPHFYQWVRREKRITEYLAFEGVSGFRRSIWLSKEYLAFEGVSGFRRSIWLSNEYLAFEGVSGFRMSIWLSKEYLVDYLSDNFIVR